MIFKYILKKDYKSIEVLKKKTQFFYYYKIFGLRNSSIIFLNRTFKFSYLYIIFFMYKMLQTKYIVLFIDTRILYIHYIWSIFLLKLRYLAFPHVWMSGFLSNFKVFINFLKYKKNIFRLKMPDLVVLFEVLPNIDIIKEVSQLQLPLICFSGLGLSYSNLYKIQSQTGIRSIYYFISIFFSLYLKVFKQSMFHIYNCDSRCTVLNYYIKKEQWKIKERLKWRRRWKRTAWSVTYNSVFNRYVRKDSYINYKNLKGVELYEQIDSFPSDDFLWDGENLIWCRIN